MEVAFLIFFYLSSIVRFRFRIYTIFNLFFLRVKQKQQLEEEELTTCVVVSVSVPLVESASS